MTFDPQSVRATREQMLLRLLFRATETMNADMSRRIRAHGFADFQPSFTAILANIDTEGTRVGTIAERLGTSRQAASQLLGEIEARGYIERIRDPKDGRAVIARHTASGRRILLAAIEVMLEIEAEYAALIGAGGLARMKGLLRRLLAATDPAGSLGRG